MVSESGKNFYAFWLEQKMRYKYYINNHSLSFPGLSLREQLAGIKKQQALSPGPRERPDFLNTSIPWP